jgi:hypothetical protein
MEQIALFAETLAAIAVLASVLYLGFQVRDSSRSNRAAAVATLLSQYDSPNSIVSGNTANARVFRLGFEGSAELTKDEWTQFQIMNLQYLTVYHAAYRFHKDGILGEEHWNIFRRDLVEFTSYPGLLDLKSLFLRYYGPDPEFRRELERIYEEHLNVDTESTFLGGGSPSP